MKLLKHLFILTLMICVFYSYCQTVNVDYLNPTSTSTNYDYARFGTSSLYYAGFMYNKIDQSSNGDRDLTFKTGTGNVVFSPSSGTTTPDYKLDVLGTICANEVKVATGWSDFVFKSDYNLKSLDQVEEFINQNGHLPDIPSAKEVQENGISLGEMDAKLLQKIEELTLYVIDLNKENEKMNSLNLELIKRIEKLEN